MSKESKFGGPTGSDAVKLAGVSAKPEHKRLD